MQRFWVLALAILTLGGCAMGPDVLPSPILIDGLQFENRSATPLSNIQLLVPATGGFVSCGHISPGASCATSFPGVSYDGSPVVVSWTQGGAPWSTGAVRLAADDVLRRAGRGQVRVVVLAPGSAGVTLLSSTP